MKKFVSLVCAAGLAGGGVVNVGQAEQQRLPEFMDIQIADDGEFYYQCEGKKRGLGAYLVSNGGAYLRVQLKDGKNVDSSGKPAHLFPYLGGDVVSERLKKWCKSKLWAEYEIGVYDLLYLQMLALKDIDRQLGGSLQLDYVLSDLGHVEVRPYQYKRILSLIAAQKKELSEEKISDLVEGFSNIFFDGKAEDDIFSVWNEKLYGNEKFKSRFFPRAFYGDTFSLTVERNNLRRQLDTNEKDLEESEENLKKSEENLKKSKQDVERLTTLVTQRGVAAVFG